MDVERIDLATDEEVSMQLLGELFRKIDEATRWNAYGNPGATQHALNELKAAKGRYVLLLPSSGISTQRLDYGGRW